MRYLSIISHDDGSEQPMAVAGTIEVRPVWDVLARKAETPAPGGDHV